MWLEKLDELRKEYPNAKVIFSPEDGDIYIEKAKVELRILYRYNDSLMDKYELYEEIGICLESEFPDFFEWTENNANIQIEKVIKEENIKAELYIVVIVG